MDSYTLLRRPLSKFDNERGIRSSLRRLQPLQEVVEIFFVDFYTRIGVRADQSVSVVYLAQTLGILKQVTEFVEVELLVLNSLESFQWRIHIERQLKLVDYRFNKEVPSYEARSIWISS